LQGLFDIKKYRVEYSEKSANDLPFEQEFEAVKQVVDAVMNTSKYNKVDLGSLFAFMDK
jgi:transcriptional regulatory protein LevR